jgi:hypothetical protein
LHKAAGGASGCLEAGKKDIVPGACGAGFAESFTHIFAPTIPTKDDFLAYQQAVGHELSYDEFMQFGVNELMRRAHVIADRAKFIVASGAILTGQDVEIAGQPASIALDHNCLATLAQAAPNIIHNLAIACGFSIGSCPPGSSLTMESMEESLLAIGGGAVLQRPVAKNKKSLAGKTAATAGPILPPQDPKDKQDAEKQQKAQEEKARAECRARSIEVEIEEGASGAEQQVKPSVEGASSTQVEPAKAEVQSNTEIKITNDILGKPRVGSALKLDAYHVFNNIVDNYAGVATKVALRSGATLYQLEGSLNGVLGRFEWIIQNGSVTHRMFVPGGIMNGVPIKPW